MPSIRSPLLALLLGSLAACAREPKPVRLGVVLGGPGVVAARLAVADANARARAAGANVQVQMTTFEQSSPTATLEAIAAADSLSRDPAVLAVVGHGNSAASIAAAQIYNAHRLPQLAPTTTAPLYGSAGPYSFRLVPDDRRQGAFLASVLAADPARRRVAVVYVNDDYGRGLWKALEASLRGSGVQVVSRTPILEGWDSAAMELAARSAADSRPDVVVWLARPPDLRAFRHTFGALVPEAAFLASDAADNPMMYAPGNEPFRGVRFVRFVDPGQQSPALRAFRARYRADRHEEPTADAVLAYDAVRVLADAVLAGARTRGDVHRYLRSLESGAPARAGLAGPVAFDTRRNGRRGYLLAVVDADGAVRSAAPARP
jgi:branched-chain amino acid transport system substrate-binding protein